MPEQDKLNDAVDRRQTRVPDDVCETQRIVYRPQFVVRYTAASACEFEPHSHSSLTVTAVLSGYHADEDRGQ